MKDQNSTKKAKKAQRKEVKKEVSKSLKEAITKHKKEQHVKKFAKPNNSKGGKDGSKFNKYPKSENKPASDKPKSILKKDGESGNKRKFEKPAGNNTSAGGDHKEKKTFQKSGDKKFVKKTDKPNGDKSSGKTTTKYTKTSSNGTQKGGDSYIDRKSFKPNFKLV